MAVGNALHTLMNALPGYAMQLYQSARDREAAAEQRNWQGGQAALDRSSRLEEIRAQAEGMLDRIREETKQYVQSRLPAETSAEESLIKARGAEDRTTRGEERDWVLNYELPKKFEHELNSISARGKQDRLTQSLAGQIADRRDRSQHDFSLREMALQEFYKQQARADEANRQLAPYRYQTEQKKHDEEQAAIANRVISEYFSGLPNIEFKALTPAEDDGGGANFEFYNQDTNRINTGFFDTLNNLPNEAQSINALNSLMTEAGVENPFSYIDSSGIRERLGQARTDMVSTLLRQVGNERQEMANVSDKDLSDYLWQSLGSDLGMQFVESYPSLMNAGAFNPGVTPSEILGITPEGYFPTEEDKNTDWNKFVEQNLYEYSAY